MTFRPAQRMRTVTKLSTWAPVNPMTPIESEKGYDRMIEIQRFPGWLAIKAGPWKLMLRPYVALLRRQR